MATTYFDNEIKAVITGLSGVPTLNEFKKDANLTLEILKKNQANKMLNDTTHLEANSLENQEWTQTVWFPEAIKSGLKYLAFLVPVSIFGQVSAEQTNEKAEEEGLIDIKYFKDKEEALKWLASK